MSSSKGQLNMCNKVMYFDRNFVRRYIESTRSDPTTTPARSHGFFIISTVTFTLLCAAVHPYSYILVMHID